MKFLHTQHLTIALKKGTLGKTEQTTQKETHDNIPDIEMYTLFLNILLLQKATESNNSFASVGLSVIALKHPWLNSRKEYYAKIIDNLSRKKETDAIEMNLFKTLLQISMIAENLCSDKSMSLNQILKIFSENKELLAESYDLSEISEISLRKIERLKEVIIKHANDDINIRGDVYIYIHQCFEGNNFFDDLFEEFPCLSEKSIRFFDKYPDFIKKYHDSLLLDITALKARNGDLVHINTLENDLAKIKETEHLYMQSKAEQTTLEDNEKELLSCFALLEDPLVQDNSLKEIIDLIHDDSVDSEIIADDFPLDLANIWALEPHAVSIAIPTAPTCSPDMDRIAQHPISAPNNISGSKHARDEIRIYSDQSRYSPGLWKRIDDDDLQDYNLLDLGASADDDELIAAAAKRQKFN